MKDILINASNLHFGGGVQVAASFITEMCGALGDNSKPSVFMSTTVKQNLDLAGFKISALEQCYVSDVYGIDLLNQVLRNRINAYGCVFTIFGPLYNWRTPFKSIVGFAQAWIIYPNNECYLKLSTLQRVKTRLKYWIQGLFFRRADLLVVELEHVKEGLIRELGIKPERIHVVHNCLSSIYRDANVWQPVNVPSVDCDLRLGFLGRNYLHKNTAIFPAIVTELEKSHNIKAKFYVTFTEAEWQACSPEFREVCINVGSLSVAQCPAFYLSLDGVVFPSLLECFSATPLEAMAMERPLFASDRPFNRDVCQEHAHYFDPLSPESAAKVIAKAFSNGGLSQEALDAARDHAVNFSSPKERAEKYLALVMQCANETNT